MSLSLVLSLTSSGNWFLFGDFLLLSLLLFVFLLMQYCRFLFYFLCRFCYTFACYIFTSFANYQAWFYCGLLSTIEL